MGAVMMDSISTGSHQGYTTSLDTYYLYCDACGSFNIGHRFTLATWAKAIAGLAVLGGAVLWIGSNTERWACFFWLVLLFFVIYPFLKEVKYLDLICRKCGNRHITRDDVLNLGEGDMKCIPDVPVRRIIKYQQSDW
jgi:hypothetical protein